MNCMPSTMLGAKNRKSQWNRSPALKELRGQFQGLLFSPITPVLFEAGFHSDWSTLVPYWCCNVLNSPYPLAVCNSKFQEHGRT